MGALGHLVAFSGLDGAGKSTQIELLVLALRERGIEPKIIWSRVGYTPAFNMAKKLLRIAFSWSKALPPSGSSVQRTRMLGRPHIRRIWIAIALLDLMVKYGIQLRWLRWCSRVVICDRYLWDTLVDLEVNQGEASVRKLLLWRVLEWVSPRPDVAFCFVIPVEESLRRSDLKGEPFRDSPEVLLQRLERYRAIAQQASWNVINGIENRSDIAKRVLFTYQELA